MVKRTLSRRRFFISTLVFAAISSSIIARAEVLYNVDIHPFEGKIFVEMTVPVNRGPVSVQIPNWAPGAYVYGNYYQSISDLAATDAKGTPLTVTHPEKNTWTVEQPGTGDVHFKYSVAAGASRRFQGTDTDYIQVSGPSTYLYVVGRKQEQCRLFVKVPGGPIVTGLDPMIGMQNTYTAPSYDVLADTPLSTGDLIVDYYQVRGKPHYIALMGKVKGTVDRKRLLHDCQLVSAAETDFFGGPPYKRYVWHFTVYDAQDGAGGLEHLNGTQISLSSGEGPRAQSVLAHEFFHLWNVKRIRSKPLGPFDYNTLPKTGALWWLEGVTDYYASILPYRYGLWQREGFFGHIVQNLNAVRTNPARLEVSPYESSYRVADANNGNGNSNGYRISYYNLGWLCGLCLDTEIRNRTNNKHSLDDVVRALYELCKDNKPGFEEDEIRKQCVRFGGPGMGDFYDQIVMKPGELPVEAQLSKMALKINEIPEHYASVGFRATPRFRARGASIRDISGPAEGRLNADDTIMAINGQSLDLDSGREIGRILNKEVSDVKVGIPLILKVKRGNNLVDVTITAVDAIRMVRTVVEDTSSTASAVSLREQWLMRKSAPGAPK